MLKRVSAKLKTMAFCMVCRISPRLNTRLRFWEKGARRVELDAPESFSEKLSWLKLNRYGHDALVRRCADKVAVRGYVEEQGLGHLLNELYGVWPCARDIDFDALPDAFALKWNFGCGFNLLCRDKKTLDIPALRKKLDKWGRWPFWAEYAELQYRGVDRRILCERFLDSTAEDPLLDYKFYCFHGEPLAVLVIARPELGEKAAVFMSPEWELISDIPARYKESLLPRRPACLEEMLSAARRLSAPFPFVRADFYEHDGKPVFGELTFTPGAGIFPSETLLGGKTMGELIDLEAETIQP